MEPIGAVQPARSSSDLKRYVLITLFAAVPVYWACLFYIEVVTTRELEGLAFAATLCFFGFLYIGMGLARVWLAYRLRTGRNTFSMLIAVLLANLLWLFLHADYQWSWLPAINLLLFWLPFILFSLLLGLLVNLGRLVVYHQIRQGQLSANQSRSELQLLQAQLSPHFLFNTLNNLYGLSLTQHEKVPPLLLQLSDLLRYSVYEAKELFVPLKSELAYIHNYIAFEQIRIGDRLQLQTFFEPITGNEIKIAPMLLITFVENAFKHAKNSADKTIFVNIELKTWGNQILFSVNNSFAAGNEPSEMNRNSGLGLANARKRLELLYPGEHELNVEAGTDQFSVLLRLKAK